MNKSFMYEFRLGVNNWALVCHGGPCIHECFLRFLISAMMATGPLGDFNFSACPLCCQRFEDPRLLPCLHTFCKRCLEDTHRRSQGQGQAPRCPTCQQGMGLGEKGVDCLPSSFLINDIVDVVVSHEDDFETDLEKDKRRMCSSCDEGSSASYQCRNCLELLCNNCTLAHQRVRLTKDHYIVRLTPQSNRMQGTYKPHLSSSPIQAVSDRPPSYCEVHENEITRLFCDTCNKPICRECTVNPPPAGHMGHSFIYLQDAGNRHIIFLFWCYSIFICTRWSPISQKSFIAKWHRFTPACLFQPLEYIVCNSIKYCTVSSVL